MTNKQSFDYDNTEWRKINKKQMKEMELMRVRSLFANILDGDYALESDGQNRARITISEAIDMHKEYEKFFKEAQDEKDRIKEFKDNAINSGLEISLKGITHELFNSKKEMDAFWEATFKIYKRNNSR